jgi:hypothetical protein
VVNLRATNGTGFGSGGGDGRTVRDIGVPHAAGLPVDVRLDVVATNARLTAPRASLRDVNSGKLAVRDQAVYVHVRAAQARRCRYDREQFDRLLVPTSAGF